MRKLFLRLYLALKHLINPDDPFQGAVVEKLGAQQVTAVLARVKERFNFTLFQAARMLLTFNRIYALLDQPEITARFYPHGTEGKDKYDVRDGAPAKRNNGSNNER